MYAGHAAVAMLVKGKRPQLSLALLVPVAYGPDWVDLFSHVVHRPNPEFSHSLVSVGFMSIMVTLCVVPFVGSAVDALIVGATYASHWVLDLVTGLKPTWPGGPVVGLHFYAHVYREFFLEAPFVVACWLVYRSSLRADVRNSVLAYVMPLGLIVLQAVFALGQAPTLK